MKTIEEIKKGLECCLGDNHQYRCDICPYNTGEEGVGCVDEGLELYADSLALIRQLEEENAKLKQEREGGDKHGLNQNAWNCLCPGNGGNGGN